jgi:hypothetical protein
MAIVASIISGPIPSPFATAIANFFEAMKKICNLRLPTRNPSPNGRDFNSEKKSAIDGNPSPNGRDFRKKSVKELYQNITSGSSS